MSTRSNIIIRNQYSFVNDEDEEIERDERVTLYKHHDGYPVGTVPLLRQFYRWNGGRNGDVEYAAANLVYFYKRKKERNTRFASYGDSTPLEYESPVFNEDGSVDKDETEEDFEVPNQKTGMGVCHEDHIHGDCEYVWVLDGEDLFMYHLGVGSDRGGDFEELIDQDPDRVYDLTAEDLREGVKGP